MVVPTLNGVRLTDYLRWNLWLLVLDHGRVQHRAHHVRFPIPFSILYVAGSLTLAPLAPLIGRMAYMIVSEFTFCLRSGENEGLD